MPVAELLIERSTMNPEWVTLRTLKGSASGVRTILSAAGFQAGERVILISKEEYDRLKQRKDETIQMEEPRRG